MGADVKPIKSFRVKIKGDYWKVLIFKDADFEKIAPGNVAETWYDHATGLRTLVFRESTNKSTIAHELGHVFFSYFSFNRYKQMLNLEEKICDIIGASYKRIHELTEDLYKRLNA